jgi:hypothetical protein
MARHEAGDDQAQRRQGGQCPQKKPPIAVIPPWCRFLAAIMPPSIGNVSDGREIGAWNI